PGSISAPRTSPATGRRAAITTTLTRGKRSGMADQAAAPEAEKKKSKFSFRAWNRAIHRDIGHIAVGLTVVYAVSAIAVNHIKEWEPNFESYQRGVELSGPVAGSDDEAARFAMEKLGVKGPPRDVYRAAPDDLEVILDNRTLHVNTVNGHVLDEG